MKIAFKAFGVDVTIIDTDPLTEEECQLARWDELLNIPTDEITDEGLAEWDGLTDLLASGNDEEE
jgi:hypothetical protein